MINLALQKGGEDNVTVQFVRYGKRSEVRHRDHKGKLKSIFLAVLIAGFGGGASFSAYMLVKNSAEENVSSLRKAINQKDSEIIQQITKIKVLDGQLAQLKVNVSERDLELANTKNAEQQAVNQIRKLENQLGLEIQAKKRFEDKLKTATQEKNIAEKRRLSAIQMVRKLEEKVFILKKKVRALEARLRLAELAADLRSSVSGKEAN